MIVILHQKSFGATSDQKDFILHPMEENQVDFR